MKNNLRLVLLVVVVLLISSHISKAVRIVYPIVTLPHTFNASSGEIDIDDDTNPDFAIEYSSTGPDYMYRIYGVYGLNQVFAENSSAPIVASQINGPLTRSASTYVTILPYQALIEVPDIGTPVTPALQSGPLNKSGSYPNWSYNAIIVGTEVFDTPPLLAAAPLSTPLPGTGSGYIGVYYYSSGSYYTGWLHYQYISPGVIQILSAGSAPVAGTPVYAGAGDPYAPPVVPISIIASFLGLLAIGGRTYLKRKKKK